jgi:putative ABC transport system ATP-binding protein
LSGIIEIENLHKVYRMGKVEVAVLRGINVCVEAGEFVSIVGPSGCGKSTLLHVIAGLTPPSSGKIFVDGEDLSAMKESQRTNLRKKTIGFVFQRFNLLPTLTAAGNISLARDIAGGTEDQIGPGTKEVVNLLGLESRMGHRPMEMSGGEQQRVAIARAVVNSPKILLADEPTGSLDTENSQVVLNMLQAMNHRFGQTILMITHNPEVALYSDRTISMRDGHILENTAN